VRSIVQRRGVPVPVSPDRLPNCRTRQQRSSGSLVPIQGGDGPSTAIRAQPSAVGDYAIDEDAAVCYIDGQIPKGPPPPQSGTIPPSFDREVIVVIRDQAYFVSAGYRRNMPIETP